MKFRLTLSFFFLSCLLLQAKDPFQNFDRVTFYATMASGIVEDIDKQLAILNEVSIPEKEAYEGALLMRKSGVLKIAVEKLKYFKKGRIKLETALLKDSNNAEYRFLRLSVQEHAPKVVKYKDKLKTDKQFIINAFKNLPAVVQRAIIDYSKKSKILNPQQFPL